MEGLVNIVFSNTDTLTPGTILEFFCFVMVVEFLGMMFSWLDGRRF